MTQQLTPHQQLSLAFNTCQQLTALLRAENAGLAKYSTAEVEASLQQKKCLTLRLEQLMRDLRQNAAAWRADVTTRAHARRLKAELEVFHELAEQNAAKLKAAHQIRADLVVTIRKEAEAAVPRARLYGANGGLQTGNTPVRVMTCEA